MRPLSTDCLGDRRRPVSASQAGRGERRPVRPRRRCRPPGRRRRRRRTPGTTGGPSPWRDPVGHQARDPDAGPRRRRLGHDRPPQHPLERRPPHDQTSRSSSPGLRLAEVGGHRHRGAAGPGGRRGRPGTGRGASPEPGRGTRGCGGSAAPRAVRRGTPRSGSAVTGEGSRSRSVTSMAGPARARALPRPPRRRRDNEHPQPSSTWCRTIRAR